MQFWEICQVYWRRFLSDTFILSTLNSNRSSIQKARWSLLCQCVAAGPNTLHKPKLNSLLLARILPNSGAQMNLNEMTLDFMKIALTGAQFSISTSEVYIHESLTRPRKPETSEYQLTIVAWPRYHSLSTWEVSCTEIAWGLRQLQNNLF